MRQSPRYIFRDRTDTSVKQLNYISHLQRLFIFLLIFIQIFAPVTQATGSIVDDAPPVDESKPYIPVTADNLRDMTAQAAILIDARTGRILYEKNPDQKLMPASTTKMMTCILGLENAAGDDIVAVDKRAVGEDGSAIYLNEGDRIAMSELLQATMLASGNDGAAAVGYYIGQGSMEKFVDMMNDKAKSLGAVNTHFNNPHGLTDPNHYTTARDLAKIAAYCYQNPQFRKIVSTKEQQISWISPADRKDVYGSTNRLLWNYDDITGIKTGYTDAAGGCLVASAEKNGSSLIAVVLKTADSRARFTESRALLDFGFKQIASQQPVDTDKLTDTVYVHGGTVSEIAVKPAQDFTYPVMKHENAEDFTYQLNLTKNYVEAPCPAGTKVGTVDLLYHGTVIGSIDMVTAEDTTEGFNLIGFLHELFFS